MPHNRGISGHRRYPPKAHLDSLGCKSLSGPNHPLTDRFSVMNSSLNSIAFRITLLRVRGISFLKTVNTLQVALQKHKGGDGPSKHEVH